MARIQILNLPSTVRNGEVVEQPFAIIIDQVGGTSTEATDEAKLVAFGTRHVTDATGAVGVICYPGTLDVVER